MVWCWFGLDLALGHDGGCATSFVVFVYLPVHDFYALEIFLDDFFPGEFDVLFCLLAGPVPHSVDHVFLDHHTDLFGEIGPGRQLRHALTDALALRQIPLAIADQVLIGRVVGFRFRYFVRVAVIS